MSREVTLILGPPGTGKTTALLSIAEQCIEKGIPPQRIAFVSFTKKAADEARERAKIKFELDDKQLPYFRTLHSLVYKQLHINKNDVMGKGDYKEIAQLLGTEFKGYMDMAEGVITQDNGDAMLRLINIARATKKDLRELWEYHEEPVDWYKLKLFNSTIEQFKKDTFKIDFNDMLDMYVGRRLFADVDVAIIDEAQDLSNAQWDTCKVAFRKASNVYIAGDDDQAIHEWAGANVGRLLSINADTRILNKTYRLPVAVYNEAMKISKRISRRFNKTWQPIDSRKGSVSRLTAVDQIPVKPGQSWMILARNNYLLSDMIDHCNMIGIPYRTVKGNSVDADHYLLIRDWERRRDGQELSDESMGRLIKAQPDEAAWGRIWHEGLTGISLNKREYYLACLRNGFKLNEAVYIGTIHSVKGGEADNVAILTDISWRSAMGLEKNPDAEHRVFYVGITRARDNLYIIDPQTRNSYAI